MKHLRTALLTTATVVATAAFAQQITLKDAYRDYWNTGVSVNQWQVKANSKSLADQTITGGSVTDQTQDWDVIVRNFNYVVAENCMKCEVIHPQEGVYDFTLADQFVDKARAAGLKVLGHCLIWHSQCAPWFHYDEQGNLVSPEVLKKRMREHITTIVSHFKGRIEAWDVVNEGFEDDGTLRKSLFYQILGEDYIPLAFQYAHEADPTAQLYYNDFSMNKAAKVEGVARYFAPLIRQGLPITAIGMQGHLILDDNNYVEEYEHSIKTITSLGVKTFFSELDLSVLPNPFGFAGANISDKFAYRPEMDPYKDGLPAAKKKEVEDFWTRFFQMLVRHRDDILRVNFWCLNDACSWRNDFPIKGRTDYATLFDRQNQPKPEMQAIINVVRPEGADCCKAAAKTKGKKKTKK